MFDPMTMMMLASNLNSGGQGDALLNPAGSMPMGGAPVSPGPQAPMGGGAGGLGSLGKMMSGIEGSKGAEPKFSGGVSGSQLPYQGRVEDMMSPFLAQMKPQQTGQLPTLGMLLGGGGR